MNEDNLARRLSRSRVFYIIALLFLAWRPGFLGSENIVLTTYYPAPYGGYVSLLATGNAFMARDGGNLTVGGGGAAGVDKLTVYGSGTAMTAVDGSVRTRLFSASSTGNGYVGTSSNHSFTFRTVDTDRMTLTTAGQLNLNGNFWIGGTQMNTCKRISFSLNSTTPCPTAAGNNFPFLIGKMPSGNGSAWLCNPLNGACHSWDNDFTGYMYCCRMSM